MFLLRCLNSFVVRDRSKNLWIGLWDLKIQSNNWKISSNKIQSLVCTSHSCTHFCTSSFGCFGSWEQSWGVSTRNILIGGGGGSLNKINLSSCKDKNQQNRAREFSGKPKIFGGKNGQMI
jgi:hypothetical protein